MICFLLVGLLVRLASTQPYPLPTDPSADLLDKCNPMDPWFCEFNREGGWLYDPVKKDCSYTPRGCKSLLFSFNSQCQSCKTGLWPVETDPYSQDYKPAKVLNPCFLNAASGEVCLNEMHRWAWDEGRHECVKFTYSGCGGNANNFETQDACMAWCGFK